MTIRAFNEAARALVLWTALQVRHRPPLAGRRGERQAADDHLGLMTPVLKGVLTDLGFDNAVKAQQMFGGHGYIEEWGMSQFVRDARIAMIYEGANGIQAMDLVGRKLGRDGGRAVMAFFNEVGAFCQENAADEALKPYVAPLQQAARPSAAGDHVVHAERHGQARQCRRRRRPTTCTSSASSRMGYMWAKMAKAAHREEGARQRRRRAHGRQARDRPLLHGAHAARDRRASRAHHGRRRRDDGAAGRDVLTRCVILGRREVDPRTA